MDMGQVVTRYPFPMDELGLAELVDQAMFDGTTQASMGQQQREKHPLMGSLGW